MALQESFDTCDKVRHRRIVVFVEANDADVGPRALAPSIWGHRADVGW
jgi:hypothetical protein